jgi:hypothetical protein
MALAGFVWLLVRYRLQSQQTAGAQR